VDVEKPAPAEDEVLVKVHAASANPYDWRHVRAKPMLVRAEAGWFKPDKKVQILGADFAGRVEAVGGNVTQFQVGDEVYGEGAYGAFAEYMCVAENRMAPKAANLSFAEAASVPMGGLTSLQAIRDDGQAKAGQKVLVNGASGGVGIFTVQLARYYDMDVTAVCSGRNADLVRSLGADHVIDYTKGDFSRNGQQYDLVVDNIGNLPVAAVKRLLKPGGICAVVGFTTLGRLFQVFTLGAWSTKFGDKTFTVVYPKISRENLVFLKERFEAGEMKPVIDKSYSLRETADALRYLETGRARGKVVIRVKNEE
jgi:NADPH:quinone reductase-like Zn-dependent oxidoreductase